MKPDLVTGGCGFVGRRMVRSLIQSERQVIIIDNLSTGLPPEDWLTEEELPSVRFLNQDVRDALRGNLLPDIGDVYHFAAVVGGRMTIDFEPLAVATDLAIDAEFFNWVVRDRPERVLFASSSAAYPVANQRSMQNQALAETMIDFNSDAVGRPDMTYGWAKLTGEYLARIAATRYGIHIACVRPFSGYGEDQEPTYPIPAIALRVARRENPLSVWGSGTQRRDFVYIDDCITAMRLALSKISDGTAVNIGSGMSTSFLEIANLFARLAGYSPTISTDESKPTGVFARYADPSSIRTLGWTPQTSLEEGLRRVLVVAEKQITD